ncbi:MAG: alcohol dehydrogenase [Hyphomicrobiales bacterium]|nr:MAG: alcohol dehydrogenase [Hyphomicrobiales bacterium]
MKRQSITAYGAPLEETNVPLPVPQGSEVLVKVAHCGVCHSDLHLHEGHFELGGGKQLDVKDGRELPFTLGHEIEGTVEACGPDASGVTVGEHCVVYPWIGCGTCPNCEYGEEHLCERPRQIGIQVDGGYATHVMVPHPRYLVDCTGVPRELAGSYMCSGLTAFGALERLGNLGKRGPILIVGLGGVGMMGLAFAKAMFGIAPYVADIDPAKREAALAAGAAAAFDPSEQGIRRTFMKETGGGVFGAIDFVGAEGSLNFAQSVLRKSGKVVVVGLMGGAFSLPIPMFPLRGIAVEGTYVGTLDQAKRMLDMVREGKVDSIPVDLRPLSEANQSLDDLRAGKVTGRIVLTP